MSAVNGLLTYGLVTISSLTTTTIIIITSKYPATQWRLTYCKVRMHSTVLFIVIILYHWLRLHQFPSPALFFVNHLSFSDPQLFLLESWSHPPLLSISPASESLSFYHDCGLKFCETFAFFFFFLYFHLPFF